MKLQKCSIAAGVLAFVFFTAGYLAAAQPAANLRRIGYLTQTSGPGAGYEMFRRELRELGYVEGNNIAIEYRSAETQPELDRAANSFLQQKVDVIVTIGGKATRSVEKASKTIPIVFILSGDPIQSGFVDSLARPGGNLTGITWMAYELSGKRLEVLKEAASKVSHVAVLANPKQPGEKRELVETGSAARSLGIILHRHRIVVHDKIGYDLAFDDIRREKANGLLVFPDEQTLEHRQQIADFAIKQRLPSIFGWREYVEAGGLLAYGPNRAESLRRVAFYIEKIFKGAKPGELPVEQPTKYELVINLKTAKALGLKIPAHLLMEADKVIE
jgi:putative ABC transport system substrate-binding protein